MQWPAKVTNESGACEALNLVKLVAVDYVDIADYYTDENPELFGGLSIMSGSEYHIQ